MIDQQDTHKKSDCSARFSTPLFFFVVVFITGALDSPLFHSGFKPILILGQFVTNVLFAILTYLRRYRSVTSLARIAAGICLMMVLISYSLPTTRMTFKLDDELEQILTITCVMMALWHSFIVLYPLNRCK